MSINLLETVQQRLGYPPIKKIDPNNKIPHHYEGQPAGQEFAQAAIPTVLTAMYRYVQSDEGATDFLNNTTSNWADVIFEDHKQQAVEMVAGYAQRSPEDTISEINRIATQTVTVVKEQLPGATIKSVKTFFQNQANTILLYLPPEIHAGDALNDAELDDKTNKMEGPISSLIKSIGAAFSSPVTREDVQSKL
jgi:hypothetical protein